MDRTTIRKIKEDLSPFLSAMSEGGHGLEYACLIPAYEGIVGSPLVLQVYAEWINNMECSEAIKLVVQYLFAHTSRELREKIYSIDLYDENGSWYCKSADYILVGESPMC